jgi:tripartite-type tricarboxylate transporter receptor subunit TctC
VLFRSLALTNDRRFPPAGGIPPLREVVPGYASPPFWTSYYGPANMPQPVLRRANTEIVKALEAPDIRSKLTEAGFLVVGSTPEELAATNRADIEMAAKIVKLAGIQPE